jgi:hypothetical protein
VEEKLVSSYAMGDLVVQRKTGSFSISEIEALIQPGEMTGNSGRENRRQAGRLPPTSAR